MYFFVAVETLSRFLWVYPIKRKSEKLWTVALNSINTFCQAGRQQMQPKFCRGEEKVPAKPEKVWVDKCGEFAGEFADFCRKRSFTIYSNCSERNSVLAERNIRSLKALIFKYLHENITDIYLDQLPNFVSIINGRINCVTHVAPENVDVKGVPFLITPQATNKLQEPKFKIGQKVRIRQEIDSFYRGYRIQFTELVFTIAAIQTPNPPTYSLSDCNNQVIQGKIYEPELVHLEHINNNNNNKQRRIPTTLVVVFFWFANTTHTHTPTNVSTEAFYYEFNFKGVYLQFPDKTLANFTTLLPHLIQPMGDCGNVLAELCTKCSSRELFLSIYKLPRQRCTATTTATSFRNGYNVHAE